MTKTILFTAVSLICIFNLVTGQPAPAKYGKIDMADLEMKVYDRDTTAEAVILCDYGVFNSATLDFQRLLRIKVLKKEGTDIVNRVYYITGQGSVKGCTYNLVDGQIVESKLKNESIFKEEVRDDRYRYRITMPDVRAGSVVEILYSFPLLPGEWSFQDRVPVRWSELRIPSNPYVTFQKVFYGFEPLYINEPYRWVAKDMPALRPEPYINSIVNYLNRAEFELSSIDIPGYMRFFTTSWDAVNTFLLDNKYFGEPLKGLGMFLNEDAKAIKELNLPELARMKAACDLVRQKIKWNDIESLYTTGEISFAYKKGSGNSADVNIILVHLLKKLDLDAFPVALSTRENGLISPAFPTIDKLNYVIAGVKFNGKNYLFDATDPYTPAGLLPFRALNGRGRIIDDEYSGWIDLIPACDEKETVYIDMKIDETGLLKGTISYTDYDYDAWYFRKNYKSYNSQNEYLNSLESQYPGLTIEKCTFTDIDSLMKPVVETYEVSLSGYSDLIGDMISLNPLMIERLESNPFKLEKRKYPIDYGHCIKKRIILSLLLPEGFEVSEVPLPSTITLPDKSAQFTYNISNKGNSIQMICNFNINKTLFVESEYALIKEFYNQVIAKQKEVILLKKKA
ncbi:MAG TPA: DUF3857 domain-containing protein [Bacteroidales bacterium]|jgi:hypothetical protein|nr:DUF3857 domain-containing protein [Bacteroidales bacterium]